MLNNNILQKRMSPILKWAGGKEQELKYIHPAMPDNIDNYYEPFIGGGAVYFSIIANRYLINDKSEELISLYNIIKNQDEEFFKCIDEISYNWALIKDITNNNSK
jgi:DNA adenine methylase